MVLAVFLVLLRCAAQPTQLSLMLPPGGTLSTYPGTLHLDGDAVLFVTGPPAGVAQAILPVDAVCSGAGLPGRPTQYTLRITGLENDDIGKHVQVSPQSVSIGDAVIPSGLRWVMCTNGTWKDSTVCGAVSPSNWTFAPICNDGVLALVADDCTESAADCVQCGPTGTPGCGCVQGEPAGDPVDVFAALCSVLFLLAALGIDLFYRGTPKAKWFTMMMVQENLELCAYTLSFFADLVVQLTWKAPNPGILVAATVTSGLAAGIATFVLFVMRKWDRRAINLARLIGNVIFATSTTLSTYAIVTYTAVAEVVLLYPIAVLVSGIISFAKCPLGYRKAATAFQCLTTFVNLFPVLFPSCPHQRY